MLDPSDGARVVNRGSCTAAQKKELDTSRKSTVSCFVSENPYPTVLPGKPDTVEGVVLGIRLKEGTAGSPVPPGASGVPNTT